MRLKDLLAKHYIDEIYKPTTQKFDPEESRLAFIAGFEAAKSVISAELDRVWEEYSEPTSIDVDYIGEEDILEDR